MINFSILDEVTDDEKVAPFTAISFQQTAYNIGDCNAIVSELRTHKDVHFVTNGDFSLHELVDACINKLGKVNNLILSTFSFTELPARFIGQWLEDNKIMNLYALVDVRAKANYPNVFQQLGVISKALAIVPVHAKVTILESDEYTITITGSANWTTNPRYEVGCLTMCKTTAEFHKQWIFKAINEKSKHNASI